MNIQQIKDDLAFLQAWEDRFEYIMDLGRELPDYPEELRIDSNKVKGCMSQVWLVPDWTGRDSSLRILVDSDSALVKGLAAVLAALYEGFKPGDPLPPEASEIFMEMGLAEHLTPGRRNGLASMERKILTFLHIRSDS